MVSPAKRWNLRPENKVRTDIDQAIIEKIGGKRTVVEAGAMKNASIGNIQDEYRNEEEE